MYTVESLIEINPIYHQTHRFTQADADTANRLVEAISKERSSKTAHTGDIIEYTTRYGYFYPNGHFDSFDAGSGKWTICEHPHVPFVKLQENGDVCYFKTGGGEYTDIPNEPAYIGTRRKRFRFFGTGSFFPAHSAVYFEAEVNVWEYKDPDPLYGEYTTKDWRRSYVSLSIDSHGNPKNGSPYRYFGDGFAFVNKSAFDAWLKTYKSVTFKVCSNTQTVVFSYREKDYLIDKSEWDALDLPLDTRMINGINLVKVRYDDENHTVHTYRCTNSGQLDRRKYCEYMLGRGKRAEDVLKLDKPEFAMLNFPESRYS